MKNKTEFQDEEVEILFETYPQGIKNKLLLLRQLIFDVALKTKGVGRLEETLKWGQPAYLTNETKSGSTVRVDQVKSQKGRYAIYFHCKTGLVDMFRDMYPDLKYEGNRAIVFDESDDIPIETIEHCIKLALTYKLNKKKSRT